MQGATNAHSLLLQTSTNWENHGQLHSKLADMKFNVCVGRLTLNFMWEWPDLDYVVLWLSSTHSAWNLIYHLWNIEGANVWLSYWSLQSFDRWVGG